MATKQELENEVRKLRAALAQKSAMEDTQAMRSPDHAAKVIRDMCDPENECFIVLLLDARHKIIRSALVAMGTLNQVDVHPRNVFQAAVRHNASSLIVGHNHPSGDTNPSEADIDLTKRLAECGRILGIPVLDHIIVNHIGGHLSFVQKRLME